MPDALPPALPRSKRAVSQRAEHVVADAVTTTVTEEDPRLAAFQADIMGKVTNELRTTQTQIAEWQGTQMAGYEATQRSLEGTNQAITALAKQVGTLATEVQNLARDRTADAQFIEEKRAEEAKEAKEAELEAVRRETRAAIVLEQQEAKRQADEQTAKDDATARQKKADEDAKRNKILYMLLTAVLTAITGLTIYIVTAPVDATGKTLAEAAIGGLVVGAVVLAVFIKPGAGV